MSIHPSLRSGVGLAKHRNVLSRVERLEKLEKEGKWTEVGGSVLGLPKVRSIKVRQAKKAKKEDAEAGAEGAKAAT